MKKLILALCIFLQYGKAMGQLSIAPTAVYIDKNGIGNLYVTNNSAVSQEITINFQFGYSSQDENGVLIMVYDDSVNAKNWGLENMIKAFPRTFILPPKQQQIVRLQARLPKNLPAGTYFTRLKVGSSGQVADIGSDNSPGGVTTQVNLRFEQVIVAFYKNGEVNTGLSIDKIETKADSNVLTLFADYKTTGNSPYLGRVKVIVKNPAGKVISEGSQSIALYFSGRRRFSFYTNENLKPGKYDVEFQFETTRSDIPSEDLVQAKPFVHKTSVLIN